MPKKPSSTPLLPIIIILAVIASGLFFLFEPQKEAPAPPVSPKQENTLQSPTEKVKTSPKSFSVENNAPSPSPDDQEIRLRLAPMEAMVTNPCLETTQRLDLFFAYLDEQEYIEKYQFSHGSKEMISSLINTLLESPPVINGKGLNNADIIRNSAHIYRTLGAQNLTILLKIIVNEADLMEETCRHFHAWLTISRQCLNHSYPLRPSLENLYEYASFILETTGGKAYLARRQGSLRLLAQHYSVLIVHQAEQQGLNKYNINLASLLPDLIGNMEESEELAEKNSYLASLYDIREQLPKAASRQ